MRRTWRSITAVPAGLGIAAAVLVAAPVATSATAPAVASVTPGDRSLTVSWTPTAGVGDDTVVYTASAFTTASSVTAVSSCTKGTGTGYSDDTTVTPLSCTIPSLTNGVSYFVSVSAVSTATPGGVTGEREGPLAPPRTTPGTPTGFMAASGNASVTLTWQPPVDSGGVAITGYTVTRTLPAPAVNGCTTTVGVTANPLTCTITGLSNGTAYTFALAANNAAGSSATPATVTATPGVAPSAPTSVVATPGDAQATVTWTAPATTGSSALSGYTVTASPGGRQCTSAAVGATAPATTCVVTGLTNGTAYTFTVTASNATNTSAASLPSTAVTPRPASQFSIELTKAERDRKDRIRVAGITTGLEAGDEVRIRVRLYNRNTGGWRKAVTESFVKVNEEGRFRYVFSEPRELRVFGNIPGETRSDSIRVPRA